MNPSNEDISCTFIKLQSLFQTNIILEVKLAQPSNREHLNFKCVIWAREDIQFQWITGLIIATFHICRRIQQQIHWAPHQWYTLNQFWEKRDKHRYIHTERERAHFSYEASGWNKKFCRLLKHPNLTESLCSWPVAMRLPCCSLTFIYI